MTDFASDQTLTTLKKLREELEDRLARDRASGKLSQRDEADAQQLLHDIDSAAFSQHRTLREEEHLARGLPGTLRSMGEEPSEPGLGAKLGSALQSSPKALRYPLLGYAETLTQGLRVPEALETMAMGGEFGAEGGIPGTEWLEEKGQGALDVLRKYLPREPAETKLGQLGLDVMHGFGTSAGAFTMSIPARIAGGAIGGSIGGAPGAVLGGKIGTAAGAFAGGGSAEGMAAFDEAREDLYRQMALEAFGVEADEQLTPLQANRMNSFIEKMKENPEIRTQIDQHALKHGAIVGTAAGAFETLPTAGLWKIWGATPWGKRLAKAGAKEGAQKLTARELMQKLSPSTLKMLRDQGIREGLEEVGTEAVAIASEVGHEVGQAHRDYEKYGLSPEFLGRQAKRTGYSGLVGTLAGGGQAAVVRGVGEAFTPTRYGHEFAGREGYKRDAMAQRKAEFIASQIQQAQQMAEPMLGPDLSGQAEPFNIRREGGEVEEFENVDAYLEGRMEAAKLRADDMTNDDLVTALHILPAIAEQAQKDGNTIEHAVRMVEFEAVVETLQNRWEIAAEEESVAAEEAAPDDRLETLFDAISSLKEDSGLVDEHGRPISAAELPEFTESDIDALAAKGRPKDRKLTKKHLRLLTEKLGGEPLALSNKYPKHLARLKSVMAARVAQETEGAEATEVGAPGEATAAPTPAETPAPTAETPAETPATAAVPPAAAAPGAPAAETEVTEEEGVSVDDLNAALASFGDLTEESTEQEQEDAYADWLVETRAGKKRTQAERSRAAAQRRIVEGQEQLEEQIAEEESAAEEARGKFKAGSRVAYKGLPGEVKRIRGDSALVQFDFGGMGTVPLSQLQETKQHFAGPAHGRTALFRADALGEEAGAAARDILRQELESLNQAEKAVERLESGEATSRRPVTVGDVEAGLRDAKDRFFPSLRKRQERIEEALREETPTTLEEALDQLDERRKGGGTETTATPAVELQQGPRKTKARIKMDPVHMLDRITLQAYSGVAPTVVIKEAIQNAVDAIRTNPDRGARKNISVEIDSGKRKIVIDDTGRGMTGDVAKAVLFTAGRSFGKEGEGKTAGGFGVAFMYVVRVSKNLRLETVSYEKEQSLDEFLEENGIDGGLDSLEEAGLTEPEVRELFKRYETEVPTTGRKVKSVIKGSLQENVTEGADVEFNIPVPDSTPTGTRLEVEIVDASSKEDRVQGKLRFPTSTWEPGSYELANWSISPFQFANWFTWLNRLKGINVKFRVNGQALTKQAAKETMEGWENFKLPMEKLKKFTTIVTPGAHVDIYIGGGEVLRQSTATILNNGLPQFAESFAFQDQGGLPARLPKQIVLDVRPRVDPTLENSSIYPFSMQRESLEPSLHDAIGQELLQWTRKAAEQRMAAYEEAVTTAPIISTAPNNSARKLQADERNVLLVDTSQAVEKSTLRKLMGREGFKELALAVSKSFYKLRGTLQAQGLLDPDSDPAFGGIALLSSGYLGDHGALGMSVDASLFSARRGRQGRMTFIDPWVMAMELFYFGSVEGSPPRFGSPAFPSVTNIEDAKLRFATALVGTTTHELVHEVAPGSDPQHAAEGFGGQMTRFMKATMHIQPQLAEEILAILDAHPDLMLQIAMDAKEIQGIMKGISDEKRKSLFQGILETSETTGNDLAGVYGGQERSVPEDGAPDSEARVQEEAGLRGEPAEAGLPRDAETGRGPEAGVREGAEGVSEPAPAEGTLDRVRAAARGELNTVFTAQDLNRAVRRMQKMRGFRSRRGSQRGALSTKELEVAAIAVAFAVERGARTAAETIKLVGAFPAQVKQWITENWDQILQHILSSQPGSKLHAAKKRYETKGAAAPKAAPKAAPADKSGRGWKPGDKIPHPRTGEGLSYTSSYKAVDGLVHMFVTPSKRVVEVADYQFKAEAKPQPKPKPPTLKPPTTPPLVKRPPTPPPAPEPQVEPPAMSEDELVKMGEEIMREREGLPKEEVLQKANVSIDAVKQYRSAKSEYQTNTYIARPLRGDSYAPGVAEVLTKLGFAKQDKYTRGRTLWTVKRGKGTQQAAQEFLAKALQAREFVGTDTVPKAVWEKLFEVFGLKARTERTRDGRTIQIVEGKTRPVKEAIKSAGGFWRADAKHWEFAPNVTDGFARVGNRLAFQEPIVATDAARTPDERRLRERAVRAYIRRAGRAGRRTRHANPSELVGADTVRLLNLGRKQDIPQDVIDEQVEDVGSILHAHATDAPLFLLANEPGTGKTFVLGASIRDLRKAGAKKFLYFTVNKNLIDQVQRDLREYEIGDVRFATYASLNKTRGETTAEYQRRIKELFDYASDAVVIMDEGHFTKNEEGTWFHQMASLMDDSKLTIVSSATPFEHPVQAKYLAHAGVFDGIKSRVITDAFEIKKVGDMTDSDVAFVKWAYSHGASVKFNEGSRGKPYTVTWEYVFSGKKGHRIRRPKYESAALSRNWFIEQGLMTQRNMRLPPGRVSSEIVKVEVSEDFKSLMTRMERVYAAAKSAAAAQQDIGDTSLISAQLQGRRKRLAEAAKVESAATRAKAALKAGQRVALFVETKSETWIGKFRYSEAFRKKHRISGDQWFTPEQVVEMMSEYRQEAAAAKMQGGRRPTAPFGTWAEYVSHAMLAEGFQPVKLPATAVALAESIAGKNWKPLVAMYTGDQTDKAASRGRDDFLNDEKRVIVVTSPKGGTGLSLHDKVGNRPTTQIVVTLPWSPTQMLQVAQRVARYGIRSDAKLEWLGAAGISFEKTLGDRIGMKLKDMGATVKGVDVSVANTLLEEGWTEVGATEISKEDDDIEIDADDILASAQPSESIREGGGITLADLDDVSKLVRRTLGEHAPHLLFVNGNLNEMAGKSAIDRHGFKAKEENWVVNGVSTKGLITLSLAQGRISFLKAARHEVFHHAKRLGILNAQDIENLRRAYASEIAEAAEQGKSEEEVLADKFGEWYTQQYLTAVPNSIDPKAEHSIWQKLLDWLKSVGRAFERFGYGSPEQVFGALESGQLAELDDLGLSQELAWAEDENLILATGGPLKAGWKGYISYKGAGLREAEILSISGSGPSAKVSYKYKSTSSGTWKPQTTTFSNFETLRGRSGSSVTARRSARTKRETPLPPPEFLADPAKAKPSRWVSWVFSTYEGWARNVGERHGLPIFADYGRRSRERGQRLLADFLIDWDQTTEKWRKKGVITSKMQSLRLYFGLVREGVDFAQERRLLNERLKKTKRPAVKKRALEVHRWISQVEDIFRKETKRLSGRSIGNPKDAANLPFFKDFIAVWEKHDDGAFREFVDVAGDQARAKIEKHWPHLLSFKGQQAMFGKKGAWTAIKEARIEQLRRKGLSEIEAEAEVHKEHADYSKGHGPWTDQFRQKMGPFERSREGGLDLDLIEWGMHGSSDYFRRAGRAIEEYATWARPTTDKNGKVIMNKEGRKVIARHNRPDQMMERVVASAPIDDEQTKKKLAEYLKVVGGVHTSWAMDAGVRRGGLILSQFEYATKLHNPITILKNTMQPIVAGAHFGPQALAQSLAINLAHIWPRLLGGGVARRWNKYIKEKQKNTKAGVLSGTTVYEQEFANRFTLKEIWGTTQASTERIFSRRGLWERTAFTFMHLGELAGDFTVLPGVVPSFQATETFTNLTSATAANYYANDLIKVLMGSKAFSLPRRFLRGVVSLGELRQKPARRILKEYFLLTDEQIDESVANGQLTPQAELDVRLRGAENVNFRSGEAWTPGWVVGHDGWKRVVRTFRNFAYNQARMLTKHSLKELTRHGNPKPLVYQLGGGYLAYSVVSAIMSMLFGMKDDEKDWEKNPVLRRINHVIRGITEVGMIGILEAPGDLISPSGIFGAPGRSLYRAWIGVQATMEAPTLSRAYKTGQYYLLDFLKREIGGINFYRRVLQHYDPSGWKAGGGEFTMAADRARRISYIYKFEKEDPTIIKRLLQPRFSPPRAKGPFRPEVEKLFNEVEKELASDGIRTMTFRELVRAIESGELERVMELQRKAIETVFEHRYKKEAEENPRDAVKLYRRAVSDVRANLNKMSPLGGVGSSEESLSKMYEWMRNQRGDEGWAMALEADAVNADYLRIIDALFQKYEYTDDAGRTRVLRMPKPDRAKRKLRRRGFRVTEMMR